MLKQPIKCAAPEIKDFLANLRRRVNVGIVGGSDLVKIQEQLGENIVHQVDYNFSENGLVAYKDGNLIAKQVLLNKAYRLE